MSSASSRIIPRRGGLAVISGPAGVGKSTVVRKLLSDCPLPLVLSVSATTRPPRPGEVNGIDYHFLSPEEFQRRRDASEFLECKEVFGLGRWYGTLQSEVSAGLNAGQWVILEIDVQGAMSVLETHPETVTIFIHCGSLEELERRLRNRGTENEAQLQRRLEVARQELTYLDRYQYSIINNDVSQAAREICEILARHGAHT